MKKIIKLDYGSGYNPKAGFKTADMVGRPDYYIQDCQVLNLPDKSCRVVCMKNVFHHVLNTDKLNKEMERILEERGRLVVVEPSKENYESNKFWDQLWYRGIIPRSEIVWSNEYRDPAKHFKSFKLITRKLNNPYEVFIFETRY